MKEQGTIEKILKQSGYKLTGQRRILLEFFQEKPGHYTAQEIFEQVRDRCGGINFSTIYRNLELLCSLKIITRLELSNGVGRYKLSGPKHHHHIICKGCGEMKEIDLCPYECMSSEELEALGFTPTEHKFEIYGYCKNCCKNK